MRVECLMAWRIILKAQSLREGGAEGPLIFIPLLPITPPRYHCVIGILHGRHLHPPQTSLAP